MIVYRHNHVFGNYSFATIFTEGMQERLAPNDWLKKVDTCGSGRRGGHGGDAWCAALNYVGEGQPDIHNEYTNKQFLQTAW